MKKCPFCAAENQDEAGVCRFCGRDFPAADVRKPAGPNDNPELSLGWFAYALIGLVVAVLALVWLATSSNTQASPPILSTNPRLTLMQRLANLTRVSTPAPESTCVGWYEVTPEMRGQHVCVFGMVLDYKEDWASQQTYIYFGSNEEFFLVSDFRWNASFEDTCITAEGTVQLDVHETPYIEVVDIYDCQ